MKRLACCLAVVALLTGCGEDERDLFVVQYDAGTEAGDAAGTPDGSPEFDPTLGGPCTEDSQCDDKVSCTADRCDQTLARCRNTPDDSLCQDDTYCNGKERCVLRQGCAAGPVVTCQDDNPCTIDRCIEASKTCEHAQRDADGDGDPDDHCVGDKDCDDFDPLVSSIATEVCGNAKDDDCDGTVDEAECATAKNDVCGTGVVVTASASHFLTTVAAKRDYATTCNTTFPGGARDVALQITNPGTTAVNVVVSARGYDPTSQVGLALADACPDPPAGQVAQIAAFGCGFVEGVSDARAIKRRLGAGKTVYAIVTTGTESSVDVEVDFEKEADAPTNETCATAEVIPAAKLNVPFPVTLIDPAEDVATGCSVAKTGELFYAFDLAVPTDVRIFPTTLKGSGRAVVGIHDAACTETRCRPSGQLPTFARLGAGRHYFSVSATSQIEANITVQTSTPVSTAPTTQSCKTTDETITPNGSRTINLYDHEDEIRDNCLEGGAVAAFELELTRASDVLLIGRFPLTEVGAVSLHNADTCSPASRVSCGVSARPARATARAAPPGKYFVVVADQTGQTVKVDALVRDYAAPVDVTTSNGCLDAITIPATGGFFTGDNSVGATADFDGSCDVAGVPFGGAADRIMKLVLANRSRVVLDMQGSFYMTMLAIRQGATCPGVEIPNGCYAGLGSAKSFFDITLDPGTYWVQVDGYNNDKGKWSLDVRVLPP